MFSFALIINSIKVTFQMWSVQIAQWKSASLIIERLEVRSLMESRKIFFHDFQLKFWLRYKSPTSFRESNGYTKKITIQIVDLTRFSFDKSSFFIFPLSDFVVWKNFMGKISIFSVKSPTLLKLYKQASSYYTVWKNEKFTAAMQNFFRQINLE